MRTACSECIHDRCDTRPAIDGECPCDCHRHHFPDASAVGGQLILTGCICPDCLPF